MAAETTITAIIAAFSAIVGVAIGAAVSLQTSARNIKVENITKERAKWRDKVRKKSLAVHQDAVKCDATALEDRHLEFSLILNPFDSEDRAILALIRQLKSKTDEPRLTEFADRIALLLKHDWQRAKWEAEANCFLSPDIDAEPEPKRTTYEQFRRDNANLKR